MSLVRDVLRSNRDVDPLAAKLGGLNVGDKQNAQSAPPIQNSDTSDDEELVGVVSMPGTPRRLQSRQVSRSGSPTRGGGATSRPAPGPLHLGAKTASKLSSRPGSRASSRAPKSKTDPVRLPTDVVQNIFSELTVKDLAKCSRVSLKWNSSQSLNYIWYQLNRDVTLDNGDSSTVKPAPPAGKWTRSESKQNWRKQYMLNARAHAEQEPGTSYYGYLQSGTGSAPGSGYSTPREIREERWAQEAAGVEGSGLSKLEMRDLYKASGGRKARTKTKAGMAPGGQRDKGGYDAWD